MAARQVLDMFRAAVREGAAVGDRFPEFEEDTWPAASARIAAVFGLAVHRRFEAPADRRAIISFVAATRTELSDRDDIPPAEAEALIRSALGESGAAEGISPDIAAPTQIILAVRMLRDERLTEAALDKHLAEADALAERWGA